MKVAVYYHNLILKKINNKPLRQQWRGKCTIGLFLPAESFVTIKDFTLNIKIIWTVKTHLYFSRFPLTDKTRPPQRKPPSLQASVHAVNKAVACQGLHCKICMSQWNMYIAVCHQWHGFYKDYMAYTGNACFSDSIPLTLMGVDTKKDSSGGIIKPDINVFGVHLNTSH